MHVNDVDIHVHVNEHTVPSPQLVHAVMQSLGQASMGEEDKW